MDSTTQNLDSAILRRPTSRTREEGVPFPPATAAPSFDGQKDVQPDMVLELQDGSLHSGFSFGANKSIAGECVFQTGFMVGYPESITDPSYAGQILVITYPLVGNYGVPSRLNRDYFESDKIHIAGLVVSSYSGNDKDFSHFLAESDLATWLKEEGVPAICGVDTRALTKKIREKGVMLGKLLERLPNANPNAILTPDWHDSFAKLDFFDPNTQNLVAKVASKPSQLHEPKSDNPIRHPSGRNMRVLAIDVGMKANQTRCFVNRGMELKVVPWDYDFLAPSEEPFDGLFVSNGPGDPVMAEKTIERLRVALQMNKWPIFGICLGHQLLALASGAKTNKLKYGNRGHNIPCTDVFSGRCYITSQNHGYAVDTSTLQDGWKELFVNANDGSNEGIISTKQPVFSVQFHPESTPGPRDTELLFDVFIDSVVRCAVTGKLEPVTLPGGTLEQNIVKSPRVSLKKVLILGSGGLSIGQAGEFDYSGSQAIKALKEEGIYTILINPNIATIQTSSGLADKVYFLPVTPDFVRKVIQHERPDGIYVTFGGQTALNVGIKLKDEFEGLGVKVLGTPIDTILMTEDRELFANAMLEINEHCAQSSSAVSTNEALKVAEEIGYPVICRAAFALGGLGSGFANNEKELVELCNKAFATSPQVLIEKSMKGWKEIEYEVVRDGRDNCITVCNMENFDPLGIHTGDSIVVAPSQTLSDEDYNMLRNTAVKVIRHLGVVGECNIQYALNPHSKEYCIIEVNARLSRSSALASKATGYPLAFIAAKLGLGIPLNEIKNSVTKLTCACFEPSLDYCVVKMPRWDLRKFVRVDTHLSSSMKSVGEVMSIGRTFEEAIQKAIREIDYSFPGFGKNSIEVDDINEELAAPSDKRIFAIATALRNGMSVQEIHKISHIDNWFLRKLEYIVQLEKMLESYSASTISPSLLRRAKQAGFSDKQLGAVLGSNELAIRQHRQDHNIIPFVKQIDTVAAEFPAFTNYLYLTYNATENDVDFTDRGIMVLGSGVYRIGSSVEFDWCAVRTIRTVRERGFKTVMVNYNPETVSTDYDEADRLYFENISLEVILDIYELESSSGVILSMGGQTPNNIALPLHRQNVKVLGTSPEMIDMAENRYKFSRMLDKIGVDQPQWKELTTLQEAHEFAAKVSYPVLVRPSYVLSGAAMNVVYSDDDLDAYLTQAAEVSRDHPVVLTKYIEEAKEIEMDAVARNGKLVMHYVSEHVENAGVHSGDATLILPPQDLDPETVRRIEAATEKIAYSLNVSGPMNIQFIAKNNEIKVIECNVRAARSFPFVSKVTGIDAIEMATDVILSLPVEEYPKSLMPKSGYVGIKVPQFSFSRLSGADPILGVEMASTGEVACFGKDKYDAYLKSLLSTGITLPKKSVLFSIGSYREKLEMLPSVQKLHRLGYQIYATAGTSDFIQEHGIPVKYLEALADDDPQLQQKSEYSLTQHLANNMIDLFINLPSKNRYRRPASYMSKGYRSRRMAVDFAVPLISNVKCAKLFIEALARNPALDISNVDYKTSHRSVILPGLIDIQSFVPELATAGSHDAVLAGANSLKAGVTMLQFVPSSSKGAIEDANSLAIAKDNLSGNSFVDYAVPISGSHVEGEAISNAFSLFLPFNHLVGADPNNTVNAIASRFASWPKDKPIVTDAKSTDLASILLLASLHNRSIHITDVSSKADIELIGMSKEKALQVTCDVSIYSLFLSKDTFPEAECLPTLEDQQALWDNMGAIDIFSVGSLPYRLAQDLKKQWIPGSGVEESIHLLLSAVHENRLSLEDVIQRMSTAPQEIFDLPAQVDSYVEIELDRSTKLKTKSWSPFEDKTFNGSIHRVVFHNETVFLDGVNVTQCQWGEDVSEGVFQTSLKSRKGGPRRFSVASSGAQRPSILGPVPNDRKTSLGSAVSTSAAAGGTASSNAAAAAADQVRSPIIPPTTAGLSSPQRGAVGSTRSPQLAAADGPGSLQPSLMSLSRSDIPSDSSMVPSTVGPSSQSVTAAATAPLTNLVQQLHPQVAFFRRHILNIRQVSRGDLHGLFNLAHEIRVLIERGQPLDVMKGRVLGTLFYEPSTRTSCSFEAAMYRLGGSVVTVSPDKSSITKGESLGDTIRTLGSYTDAIALRHPHKGSVQTAAKYSPVPIINCGDGVGEHPTQAMLDVYTIREELGTVNGLTITIVGDLKNGRTVHSLVQLLSLYQVNLIFVAPPSLEMPSEVKALAVRAGISITETNSLEKVIGQTDVLYATRIQQERFNSEAEYEAVKNSYIINNDLLAHAKQNMIVMHPLPRNAEIDPEVDFDQRRAAYFRQMRFGLYVRMALLTLILRDQ